MFLKKNYRKTIKIYVFSVNKGVLSLIDLSFGCTELPGRQYYE
jgi:hypothetical protein